MSAKIALPLALLLCPCLAAPRAFAKEGDYFMVRNLDGKKHTLRVTESRIVKEPQSLGEGLGNLYVYSSKEETYPIEVPAGDPKVPGLAGQRGFDPRFERGSFGLANGDAISKLQVDDQAPLEVAKIPGYAAAKPEAMVQATGGQDLNAETLIQLGRTFEIAEGKLVIKPR